MKQKPLSHSRGLIFALFLGVGAMACAHPGPAGHRHHPDEVDEFDQVVAPVEAPSETRDVILGAVLALGAAACGSYLILRPSGLKPANARN